MYSEEKMENVHIFMGHLTHQMSETEEQFIDTTKVNDFQFNFTQCISIETNAIQRLLKNQAIEIVAEQ